MSSIIHSRYLVHRYQPPKRRITCFIVTGRCLVPVYNCSVNNHHPNKQREVTIRYLRFLYVHTDTHLNHTNFYRGGNSSLQIGHCNRNRIQPSRHAEWKMCRQGVTMYARLAKTPATPPVAAGSVSPALTTGTSSTSQQMAQSMT